MSDIHIRTSGRAGRITLNRPAALNALTWDMCLAIEAALDAWRDDAGVDLVIIDAAGDKAFCAGGDLEAMYLSGQARDYDYGRQFWQDEYRLNAKIAGYPKPYVALMQGFTMGGGVGVSCHGSHRVVCETSRIAMPECGVGLIPDVGGSHILAQATGHLGEFLGCTGFRMDAGDAIYAGFADIFIPLDQWSSVITQLEHSGRVDDLVPHCVAAPASSLAVQAVEIDGVFSVPDHVELALRLDSADDRFAQAIARQSPISVACAVKTIQVARAGGTIEAALSAEYRFTHRCIEQADFIEGIRAAIIDKDRAPKWRHNALSDVGLEEVAALCGPLGADELTLQGERT